MFIKIRECLLTSISKTQLFNIKIKPFYRTCYSAIKLMKFCNYGICFYINNLNNFIIFTQNIFYFVELFTINVDRIILFVNFNSI